MIGVTDVRKLLKFSGKTGVQASQAMVSMQEEGVAALYNILKKQQVAYLADEVGLGKTMQALGVIAMFREKNPKANILVISPREIVQQGWVNEFLNFKENVYCGYSLPSCLGRKENLYEWLSDETTDGTIPLLRHTSFSRPAFVTSGPLRAAWRQLRDHWECIQGIFLPNAIPLADENDYSHRFNVALAEAISRKLTEDAVTFDLVVVDEAQCLRNRDNQANTVLYTLFDGRVKNWLFLSATPAHSGVHNLQSVFNHYPSRGELLPDGLFAHGSDYSRLLEQLTKYMIRRPRTYHIKNKIYQKTDYRKDDNKSLAICCDTVLSTLTIALVQKHLVQVLSNGAQGHKAGFFRAGYMASFESLDDSIPQGEKETAKAETDKNVSAPDFYSERERHNKTENTPDAGFIATMSADFKAHFNNMHLPHPKIDAVVEEISENAFGSKIKNVPGGQKTLVFCRRVSSVYALRDRIMDKYLFSIEERCRRVWKVDLDWDKGLGDLPREGEDDQHLEPGLDPTMGNGSIEDGKNKFRAAGKVGEWLQRFRVTFEDGGKHATFFEENWFKRLCAEGGVSFDEAYEKVPKEIWQEALVFGTRGEKSKKRYKRRMHKYIVWKCLTQCANEVFGLDKESAFFWKDVLSKIFSPEVTAPFTIEIQSGQKTFSDQSILDFESFWSDIDLLDSNLGLAIPGGHGVRDNTLIFERQVLKTILYRYLLLSDAVVDLYFAEKTGSRDMRSRFFEWFESDDIDAIRLRDIFRQWIENRALIFRGAFAEHASLETLASRESFEYLHAMEPVMAITGGSGDRKRLVQQFNMPGLPYVVVGTDTLREGVNLHLFCSRVMHFGVAWTSGDLEQRVGRVDRYFSFIERGLKQFADDPEGNQPELTIFYPYLRDTLEKRQIDEVLKRKAENEELMDSRLTGNSNEAQLDISIDEYVPEKVKQTLPVDTGRFSVTKHLEGN
jgi:superfamily II DNA or RNA helicase